MKFTKEIRISLTAILALLLLFFGMNFLKGKSMMANSNIYYAHFTDINGLVNSTSVFANGYKVGIVQDIVFDYSDNNGIVVAFTLDNDMKLPQGTTAEIESDFMGNVKMNLLLNTGESGYISHGDTIKGGHNDGALEQLSAMVPTIQKMIPKLDSILMNVNMLVSDPAIEMSLHNVHAITEDLTTSSRQLNTLLATINNNVPMMMNKANGVLDNTQQLTANLAAIDVATTMAQVNQTIANVKDLTDKINNNEGTLGLMMRDPTLYNNMALTMSSADSLLNNIRQHPKRYVHFSVFGKKDK